MNVPVLVVLFTIQIIVGLVLISFEIYCLIKIQKGEHRGRNHHYQ